MSSYIVDSSGRYVIDKDPDAELDYSVDWDAWITPLGVNICFIGCDCKWVTVASFFNGTVTTAYISGGTVGEKATRNIQNHYIRYQPV